MAGVATQTGAGVEDVRRPEPAHITLLTRRRLETVACVATQTSAGVEERRRPEPMPITPLMRRRLETITCVATQTGAGNVTRRTMSPDTKETQYLLLHPTVASAVAFDGR